jgi:hypothetical protein
VFSRFRSWCQPEDAIQGQTVARPDGKIGS